MAKKYIHILIFSFIFTLGFILRFYNLGEIPNSLDWDEVSLGYNAYSILLTGKDEYGASFPSSFRSFGDYKPPLYVYLDILPIKLFGLNPFAVRLPSALFGSLSILLVFLLVYELFRKEKFRMQIALLSMLLFAISPWHIQFSRIAFEANVGLFFVILASFLFINGLNRRKILYLFFSILALSLSMYTYHSEKIFAPLIFLGLLFYGKKFLLRKKLLLTFLIAFFAFLNLFWLVDLKSTARGQGVLFTSDQTQILALPAKEIVRDKETNDLVGQMLHNRRLVYVDKFFQNYLSHFDPNFLFIKGDIARHHGPGVGMLYLFSLPFIILGIYYFVNRKVISSYFIFYWLLIAPIASSIAIEAPNGVRSLVMIPALQIFEAAGIFLFFIKIYESKRLKFLNILILFLLALNIFYYLHQYFNHTNTDFGKYWQDGYKQAIEYVDKYKNTERRIVFANDFEQPYIFYLFYSRYDPNKYISSGGSDITKNKCYNIDNYYFGLCDINLKKGDILLTTQDYYSPSVKEVNQIHYKSGDTAVRIFENLQ